MTYTPAPSHRIPRPDEHFSKEADVTRPAKLTLILSTMLWLLLAVHSPAKPLADEAVQLAATAVPEGAAAAPHADSPPSDAERIARLERAIEADEKRLRAIKASLTAPDGEYARAEASFKELDAQRNQRRQQLNQSEDSGSAENWARLKEEVSSVENKWALAKERFDLAISERKAGQESIITLERKLRSDRDTLTKLHGGDVQQPSLAATAAVEIPHAAPQPASERPAATAHSESVPLAKPALPTVPGLLLDPTRFSRLSVAPAVSKRLTAELTAAQANAQQSSDSATAAESEAVAIGERIQILQQDIDQQRDLRGTARKKVDNADQTLKNLNEELFRKLMDGQDISSLKQQIRETSKRATECRDNARQIATHLDDLQSTLALLQTEYLSATSIASGKRQAAALAQATVAKLENPFTPRNILQWLLDHGPRIVVILVALIALLWLSRVVETRLVSLIASRGRRGSREERENRAKTLLGVFNNVANLLVVGGGILMLLDEIGISIAPVIGGAAVLGLAVAFGAQSLIKDYFTGFMVLLEQQYLVNDVIKVGEISGQVERISLRMTVLRDVEGRVHFIPHGQITTVTNLTHGWSRAVFEVSVAYKERVDHVMAVLKKLADDMRQEEAYRLLITGEPVMLGVDSLANSAVVIKFYIQTRPLQQWVVKREMLRRIKNEFDRIGIEIPFPHLMIYQGAAKPLEAPAEDAERWGRRDVA
jgi:small conductance mechanosensitive channel